MDAEDATGVGEHLRDLPIRLRRGGIAARMIVHYHDGERCCEGPNKRRPRSFHTEEKNTHPAQPQSTNSVTMPDPSKESEKKTEEIAMQMRRSLIQLADIRDVEERLKEIAERITKTARQSGRQSEASEN